MKIVIEGMVGDLQIQDGGQAVITEVIEESAEENGFFVRLQSWNEQVRKKLIAKDEALSPQETVRRSLISTDEVLSQHTVIQSLNGRKVRVTIEVLE